MQKLFECPVCHKELEVESEWSGQKTQCPYCENEILIPNFSDEIAEAESSSCKKDVSSRKIINIIQLLQALLGVIQTAILAVILFVLINNGIKVNIPRDAQNSKNPIVESDKTGESAITKSDKSGRIKVENSNGEPEESGPYAELKKKYSLDNRHIEFMKKQPAPAVLQINTPTKNTRLMVLVELQDYYNYGYWHCKQSHYSIKVLSVEEETWWGNGYITRDSVDGEKLFDKLKDGKRHFAEIEIRYGARSYSVNQNRIKGDMFDIIKVIDVR